MKAGLEQRMEDDKVIRQMTQYKEGLVVIYTRGILQVEDIMPGLKRMKAYENVECFVQFPFHKIWRVNGIEAAGHFDTENDFFVSTQRMAKIII